MDSGKSDKAAATRFFVTLMAAAQQSPCTPIETWVEDSSVKYFEIRRSHLMTCDDYFEPPAVELLKEVERRAKPRGKEWLMRCGRAYHRLNAA